MSQSTTGKMESGQEKEMPLGIISVGPGGIITSANAAARALCGFPAGQELAGRSVCDFLDRESLLQLQRAIAEKPGSRSALITGFLLSSEGSRVEVEIIALPEEGPDSGWRYLLCADPVRVPSSSAADEDRVGVLADYTFDWEIYRGPGLEVLYTNASCERITGYAPEEFYSDPELVDRIIHPLDRQAYEEHLRRFGSCAKPEDSDNIFVFRIVTRSGQVRWIEHMCSPVFSREGRHLGRRISNRDVTEQRLAQETLKKSEERYRSIVEHMNDAYLIHDFKGRILDVNENACRMLGHERAGLVGSSLQDFEYAGDASVYSARLESLLAEGSIVFDVEYLRSDGQRIAVNVSSRVVEREGDGVIHSFVRDISARKDFEKRISESLREKDILIKEIHHRVKNNFQHIISLIGLQCEKSSVEEVRSELNTASDRIRAMALVHEQLYHSEDLYNIDFAIYIRLLTQELAALYSRADRPIDFQITCEGVFLDISKALPCGLIVNELVTNAVKYAFPDEGMTGCTIVISLVNVSGNDYELTIEDNGVGPRGGEMFDFDRPRSLGLVLLKGLVRQMDGTVECTTGRGISYVIRFSK